MSLQLWHLLCVILCVYNLLILYEESKLVIFKKQEKDLNSTDHKFSVCLPLVELIEREVFRENETFTPQQLIDKVASSFLVGREDSVILESSSVRHNHVCIDFVQEKFHRIFQNISTFQFRLHIYPANETLHYFFENSYKHNRLQFANFTLHVFVRNIRLLPAPFETNCTDIWNFPKRQPYKKVWCLTECYKQRKNSTYFLYRYDESVQLMLGQKELVTIRECHEICRPPDCLAKIFYKYLIFTIDEQGVDLPQIRFYNLWVNATPQLPASSFAIQFISLCVLFFNVSIYELSVILIKTLNKKLSRGSSTLLRNRSFLFIPKYFALVFCICLLACQVALSLIAYLRFEFIAREYYGSSKDFMPFTIFVCLPVQLAYLNVSQQLNVENEDLFLNKSLLEIRSDTNAAFKQLIDGSYLNKGDTRIPYRVEMGSETIFNREIFQRREGKPKRLLARCFRVDLNVSEFKFENNLGFTQLHIELTHSVFSIRHAVFKHRLTSSSDREHRNARLFLIKRSLLPSPYNSSCLNYFEFHSKLCSDRANCVDQCYNKHFYGNHSSISAASVIYEKDFNPSILSEARFNRSEDKEIRAYCESLYPNPDCQQVGFEEIFEQIEFFENRSLAKRIVVELYLYSTNQVEVTELTMGMWLLTLLNAECVLVGLNANKLLRIVIDSVRRVLAIRRHRKLFELLLLLLSLAGFITHSALIFQQILTSELVRSESFERLMKIDAADFMICFDTNLTQVDEYEKFTGSYFERLTANLTFESVFEKFEILDEQLRPMIIEAKDLKNHKKKIAVDQSFVYNLKCFNFETNITYQERDLFKFEDMFFVRIHFKSSLYEPECNCFKVYTAFFDKKKGSSEKLESYFLRRDKKSKVKNSFLIRPMVIEFDYTDRFYYLYKPLSLFKTDSLINDDLLYFKHMVSNFRRITNCSTQLKSLRKSDRYLFELEINDDLLAQYHFQVQRELDESDFTNPNYNVNVLNLIMLTSRQKVGANVSDITIGPTAFKQKISITNESNWARLLINILNALNTWTSMSCFDLDVYLLKFLGIFGTFFQFLLRLEKRFQPNKFIL